MADAIEPTGWFGKASELLSALAVVGADRDGEGNFIITGEPAYGGIDGDVVVSPECCYLVKGHRCRLSALMNSTSYGVRNVAVI
jgi:hypothetical protein